MNCPRCTVPNPDTSNFCTNCGSPLRGQPAGPPVAYAYPSPPPPAPTCPMCRSPYLQFFPNGKCVCANCKLISGWAYTPWGHVYLMPDPGFL